MTNKKQLFLYGVALLIIALCNLGLLVLDYVGGDFNMVTHEDALVQAITNAIIIIVLVASSISVIVGVYLGVKGVLESKKSSGGKFHIVLAKIVAIFNLVLLIIVGLSMIGSSDLGNDVFTLATCGADTIIMFEYAKVAKAVRNGEN